MSWNRKLWGVCFTTPYAKSLGKKPYLIGTLWDSILSAYKGEPPRALLFATRKDAREWCQKKMAQGHYGKLFPVRVRETVMRI